MPAPSHCVFITDRWSRNWHGLISRMRGRYIFFYCSQLSFTGAVNQIRSTEKVGNLDQPAGPFIISVRWSRNKKGFKLPIQSSNYFFVWVFQSLSSWNELCIWYHFGRPVANLSTTVRWSKRNFKLWTLIFTNNLMISTSLMIQRYIKWN